MDIGGFFELSVINTSTNFIDFRSKPLPLSGLITSAYANTDAGSSGILIISAAQSSTNGSQIFYRIKYGLGDATLDYIGLGYRILGTKESKDRTSVYLIGLRKITLFDITKDPLQIIKTATVDTNVYESFDVADIAGQSKYVRLMGYEATYFSHELGVDLV